MVRHKKKNLVNLLLIDETRERQIKKMNRVIEQK